MALWLAAVPALATTPPNTIVNDRLADTGNQDTQSGTTIVFGAGSTILCSFDDSGSYQPTPQFTGIARSINLGGTWADQGKLPNSSGGDAGFPCFARSAATGTVLLTTLSLNAPGRVNLFRSTDNGASYSVPGDASGGGSSVDRPWIACDNFAGTGSGTFYVAYRELNSPLGMYVTRSTDDGVTWSPRQLLVGNTCEFPWIVVGADHAVYVFWLNITGTNNNQYVFRRSTDQGVTFGPMTPVANLLTTGTNGDLGLGGGFRTPDNIQVVASPTDANQLYAVWADKVASPSTDKGNVYFSQTANAGATWSTPVKVNTDAGTNDQWQPVIALTPDGTALFVSWYDRRLDPANSLIDVYGRIATVFGGMVTFQPDFRITDTSFPVVVGQDPVVNPAFMGDYDTAIADNTGFYRTWGDNRFPNASATHAHQPDVFFTKVARPAVVAVLNSSGLTGENCSTNGAPDPNERVTYSVTLSSQGTQPTTNLVATLLSGTGVASPSGPQTYGALAPGASASRSFSFTASGACGSTGTAVLSLQDGATSLGTVSFPFRLGTTSAPIGPVTYFTGNILLPIPASGTSGDMMDMPIGVSAADSGQVTDVNALVRLNHTYDQDLTISLVSPAGTTVTLCATRGGAGDNFGSGSTDCNGVYTIFDDAGATAIGSGTPPFAGTYRPETPLSAFNGESPVGTWKLKIHDGGTGDVGTLYCWELQFTRVLNSCASCTPTAVAGTPPTAFAVFPNRPNPFTHSTEIRYTLPQRTPVELAVYTVEGRRVATLVHEVQGPGDHVASFGSGLATADGTRLGALPSGVYFYRLRAGSYTSARKMMLVR